MVRSASLCAVALFGALWMVLAFAAAAPRAALLEIEGPIGPATSGYFEKAQAKAIAAGVDVIVLRLDTPGGLDSAMRGIIKNILASPVPVVAWVGPGGARAASAGTYILYASQVAAMAPATNLGAATPIPVSGSWPSPKETKPEDAAKTADEKTTPKVVLKLLNHPVLIHWLLILMVSSLMRQEYLLPIITASHEMIEQSRGVYSWMAWHTALILPLRK